MSLLRDPGKSTERDAEQQLQGQVLQLPPRKTRSESPDAPSGSMAGDEASCFPSNSTAHHSQTFPHHIIQAPGIR